MSLIQGVLDGKQVKEVDEDSASVDKLADRFAGSSVGSSATSGTSSRS